MDLSNPLDRGLSVNPFTADLALRARVAELEASVGAEVREAASAVLARTRRDLARNLGGVLPRADADAICRHHGLAAEELMLLVRPLAEREAHPPVSHFYVGVVGREVETGNLILGYNIEFPRTHIWNAVHGEGFVTTRAFSRGTTLNTIALSEAHPCAHCRQYLSEFARGTDLTLIDPLGHRLTLAALYPWPFDPDYLGQKGIVAGEVRHPGLALAANDLPPATAARLTELGRRSYTPYGRAPAAIVLTLSDGTVVGGAAIESVAFNPTMSPLQAAMIDLFAHGYGARDIVDAAIVSYPGTLDYTRHARDLLGVVAPGISLREVAWA